MEEKTFLEQLRKEIVLGSLFTNDYKNTFGINPNAVQDFFDGYLEYLAELMKEDGVIDGDYEKYDTTDNLLAWYYMFDEDPLPLA